jgi:peptide/nickel transport system substrate-binding protein
MTTRALLFSAVAGLATGPAMAQENEVTIVLPEQVTSLEACDSTNSDVGRVISQNITEALTRLNPETSTPLPVLATGWEQVDDLTWRFELREGVTFQDGEAFDAEAAAYSINRLMNQEITCRSRSKLSNLLMIPTVVDEYTLDVATEEPMPILPTLVSLAMIVSPNTPMDENTNEPVGTGPYRLAEFTPERVVLEQHDNYWGEEPEIEKATYVWRSESALRAAMVATGEADLAPVIAMQDATNPETDHAYINMETTQFRIDTTVPPLDDVRVRKALNLAIDWEGLATLFGPGVIRASQMVAPSVLGHNPDLAPWPNDPDQARALLDEARADGVPVDTELNVIARSGNYPNSQEATEAMAAMWEQVGFDIGITTLDAAAWNEYLNKPFPDDRGASLLMHMHDNVTGDAVFTVPLAYRSDGTYSTVENAELDALIAEAGLATGEERDALYQEVFRVIHEDIVAGVIMFHMVGYTRVGPSLDWEPTLTTNSEIPLADIGLND